MEIIDYTGRHSVTVIGSAPIAHADGGYLGGGYLEFTGTGALQFNGNAADWAFGTGDFCVEFAARKYASGDLIAPGSHSRFIDVGEAYGNARWSVHGGSSVWNFANFAGNFTALTDGWHWFRYNKAGSLITLEVDGVMTGSGAAYRDFNQTTGYLRVGSDVDGLFAACQLANIRITRASRAGYPIGTLLIGADDPLWSQTVLLTGITDPNADIGAAPALRRGDIQTVFKGGEAADYAIESMLLATDEGLTTAVILSLFTDARAREDDALPHGDADRRGYWGDAWPAYPGESMGSRLWLVWPGKQTRENLVRAREYAQQALEWLVTDGIASSVEVQATNPRDGVLALAVRVMKPTGNALALRFESLWSDAS